MIQVLWRHTVQYSRQFEVDPFRKTQPVEYRDGVGRVVVATKSKYQTSCSVLYGLEASLKECRRQLRQYVSVAVLGVGK